MTRRDHKPLEKRQTKRKQNLKRKEQNVSEIKNKKKVSEGEE